MRFCALICLSLLLVASFCAPIHKHDTGQDASCLFCHATTRAEWSVPAGAAGQPVASTLFVVDKNPGRTMADDSEHKVRIPRSPPSLLLSL
jgi:hypothetical protein